jgi:hypothetical protein
VRYVLQPVFKIGLSRKTTCWTIPRGARRVPPRSRSSSSNHFFPSLKPLERAGETGPTALLHNQNLRGKTWRSGPLETQFQPRPIVFDELLQSKALLARFVFRRSCIYISTITLLARFLVRRPQTCTASCFSSPTAGSNLSTAPLRPRSTAEACPCARVGRVQNYRSRRRRISELRARPAVPATRRWLGPGLSPPRVTPRETNFGTRLEDRLGPELCLDPDRSQPSHFGEAKNSGLRLGSPRLCFPLSRPFPLTRGVTAIVCSSRRRLAHGIVLAATDRADHGSFGARNG